MIKENQRRKTTALLATNHTIAASKCSLRFRYLDTIFAKFSAKFSCQIFCEIFSWSRILKFANGIPYKFWLNGFLYTFAFVFK